MRMLILLVSVAAALSELASSHPEPPSSACDVHINVTSHAALEHIDARHPHGYKYRLREVRSSSTVQKEDGCEYELELELEETMCHVISPKPFEECEFRGMGAMKVRANCSMTLFFVEGKAKVKKYSCNSAPDSAEKLLEVCPDCPILLSLREPQGVQSVKQALKEFNQESSDTSLFKLLEISRLSTQYMALGQSYFAEFAIVETSCSRGAAPENEEACQPLCHNNARHGFCRSTLLGTGKVIVNCEIYDVQNETDASAHYQHHHHHHHHHSGGPPDKPCGPPGRPWQQQRPAGPPHLPHGPHPPHHGQPPLFHRVFPLCSGQLKMYPEIFPICPPPPFEIHPRGPPTQTDGPNKPGVSPNGPPHEHPRGPPF